MMKKILNKPADYVDEMLAGLCLAHPEYYTQPEPRVITRAGGATEGKVGIVTGGGSGHCRSSRAMSARGCSTARPSAMFRIPVRRADGCLDAPCAWRGGRAAPYGNYGGDVMNFDMAGECWRWRISPPPQCCLPMMSSPRRCLNGKSAAASRAWSTPSRSPARRRKEMASLEEVTRVAQKAADHCFRSAWRSPLHRAASRQAHLRHPDGQMEMGMGIHGEPGIYKSAIKDGGRHRGRDARQAPCRQAADRAALHPRQLARRNAAGGALHRLRKAKAILDAHGATVVMPLVGRYATSMEMTGMDDHGLPSRRRMEALLKAPCDCAFLEGVGHSRQANATREPHRLRPLEILGSFVRSARE